MRMGGQLILDGSSVVPNPTKLLLQGVFIRGQEKNFLPLIFDNEAGMSK